MWDLETLIRMNEDERETMSLNLTETENEHGKVLTLDMPEEEIRRLVEHGIAVASDADYFQIGFRAALMERVAKDLAEAGHPVPKGDAGNAGEEGAAGS